MVRSLVFLGKFEVQILIERAGQINVCTKCVTPEEVTSRQSSEVTTNQSVSGQTIRPSIESGSTSQLITVIGWIGIVVSLIGVFVASSRGDAISWIAVLVLFQSSVMVLGFGILVGNSDKLVAYAKQMANKDS